MSLILVLCTGVGGAVAGVQETVFEGAVETLVVNIELWATDRQGNPVTDLEASDLRIFEDGRKVEITHFSNLGSESGTEGITRIHEVEKDEPLYLSIVVDEFNTHPFHLRRLEKDILNLIPELLKHNIRISFATLDGFDCSLKVQQEFSQNSHLLREVVDELFGKTATVIHDPIREGDFFYLFFVRATMRSLEAVVTSMNGLPGRKAVLYVSDHVFGEAPLGPGLPGGRMSNSSLPLDI
jgi:VWFA-related protein